MVFVFHKFLWILIHTVYSTVLCFQRFVLHLHLQCICWWKSVQQQQQNHHHPQLPGGGCCQDDQHSIELCKKDLTKIPKHILVIMGEETPDFRFMNDLISWCVFAGITCVSFYDHKDNWCQTQTEEFKSYLASKKNGFNILWHLNNDKLCSGSIPYKNGSTRNTSIHFLNKTSGLQQISQLCKYLSLTVNCDDITIEYLESKLREKYNNFTDPDLALYFGEICCTYGVLPWQIRLTEFFNGNTQSSFDIKTFLRALYTYAKCEQRFGK